jgi:2,4-dienoyl-CoA reductase-like NADH-dependent reductase (Old Yellow Enzyme family)
VDLFESCSIAGMEMKNRLVRSATWDAAADASFMVTEAAVALYRDLGQGGIGLIVSGFAFVSPSGQAAINQYGIYDDSMTPGLRRMVAEAHRGDSRIALQIGNGGINLGLLPRQEGVTHPAVSPMPGFDRPHRQMTDEEIEQTIDDFAAAAVRGREAGFDAIQIHAAHSYMMCQFQSPLFSRRTDRWGGSPENRRRFHLEVIRRIRKAIGSDFPLLAKYGLMDEREGGLSLEEGLETVRQMVAAGLDAIEISTGVGDVAPVVRKGEETTPFREHAAIVRRTVNVPVIMVAGVRRLETACDIVASGDADMVALCRPLIREPGLVARWQRGETEPATCISCNRCLRISAGGEPLVCGEDRRLRELDAAAG